jgi:choline-sulfatase
VTGPLGFSPRGLTNVDVKEAHHSVRILILALLPFVMTCRAAVERPPVILISVDTLRSDRLPMYGYDRVATPAFDSLRRDGVLFRNAWSHSPLTLPSHASMLTGLLPASHGVRDNTGFRLAENVPTLASLFAASGYETAAAVSAFVLRKATAVDRGFGFYDDELGKNRRETSLGHIQRSGDETVAAALRWIDGRSDRPFFFFLHLYEPHSPYDPPEPYASRYSDRYDGEIAHTDAIVGRFLDHLKRKGIYDRAMIVLVSDHGEGLGDHGEDEHGIFLYREAIAVPLVIKLPGATLAGETASEPASIVDLAPTMLRQAGVELPKTLDGLPLFDGKRLARMPARAIYSETWYPRFHFGWSELHSLVEGSDHFIDAPRPELYDLTSDPRERKNLAGGNRRRLAAMRAAIQPRKRDASAPAPVSQEEREKLAALGYVGSVATASDGPRADPKDKIGTFRELQAAFRLSREEREQEALAAVDALLVREPDMIDLWDVRSKTLLRLGRTDEAIDSAKEALRRNPSATHVAADLANALLLAGRTDEARQHAELALRSDPTKARSILARIALADGDLSTAEREAREAVASGGDIDAALFTLATVQQQRGDHAAVLATIERLRTQPRGVAALRGDALARLGRTVDAEAAFRSELAAFPDSADAARRLVLLLVAENRAGEATEVIRGLAASAPGPRTYASIAETLRIVGDERGFRYWNERARAR